MSAVSLSGPGGSPFLFVRVPRKTSWFGRGSLQKEPLHPTYTHPVLRPGVARNAMPWPHTSVTPRCPALPSARVLAVAVAIADVEGLAILARMKGNRYIGHCPGPSALNPPPLTSHQAQASFLAQVTNGMCSASKAATLLRMKREREREREVHMNTHACRLRQVPWKFRSSWSVVPILKTKPESSWSLVASLRGIGITELGCSDK